jgi:hypothetical protein
MKFLTVLNEKSKYRIKVLYLKDEIRKEVMSLLKVEHSPTVSSFYYVLGMRKWE